VRSLFGRGSVGVGRRGFGRGCEVAYPFQGWEGWVVLLVECLRGWGMLKADR